MNTLFLSPLLLLMAISILSSSASAACTDVLVEISPCLPYISSPPNNLSTDPSHQCCDLYNLSFINRTAPCLCYLLTQQLLLGFPINITRISSLSSLCPPPTNFTSLNRNLDDLCHALQTLPPLGATSIAPSPSPVSSPGPSPGFKDSPTPSPSTALESTTNSPSPASSSSALNTNSSSSTPVLSPASSNSSSGSSAGSPTSPAHSSGYYSSPHTMIVLTLLWHLSTYAILYPSFCLKTFLVMFML